MATEQEQDRGPGGYGERHRADLGKGLSLPIEAFACVPQKAIDVCAAILENMLRWTPHEVKARLTSRGVCVAVIGVDQVSSDIPAHRCFRGTSFDQATRGVGGTLACPCSTIAEENLLMYSGDVYFEESVMVHEFGHTVTPHHHPHPHPHPRPTTRS